MRTLIFRQLLLVALASMPNLAFSQIKVWSQCINSFLDGPDAATLSNKIAFDGESTPAMFSLNRKVTPRERTALEKYIQHLDDCDLKAGMAVTSKNLGNLYVQLKDGLITFSTFALENLKRQIEAKYYLDNLEKLENRNVITPQFLNLSCLFESGPVIGTESQFQINETAKTIWANRGAAPSNINFGPTEINFKQSDLYVVISRNTGRFSVTLNNTTHGGKCELIKERKF